MRLWLGKRSLEWFDYEVDALRLLLEPALGREAADSIVAEAEIIELNEPVSHWYEVVARHPAIPEDWTLFPPPPAVSGASNNAQLHFDLMIWGRHEFGLGCSATVVGGPEVGTVKRQRMRKLRVSGGPRDVSRPGRCWVAELESPIYHPWEVRHDGKVQEYSLPDIVRIWVWTSPRLVFITVEDSSGRGHRMVDYPDQSDLSIDAPGDWVAHMEGISGTLEWVETYYPRPTPRRELPLPG